MELLKSLFGAKSPVVEIDVSSTVAALDDPNVQVIDCRSRREWTGGHVAGATLMPLDTLGKRMGELDKTQPVIVMCRSGHRSAVAVRQLTAAGFGDVRSMKGGLNAWTRMGNRLVR